MTHFDSGKNLLEIVLFSDCIFTIQGKLSRQKNQPTLWHGGTGQNCALGHNALPLLLLIWKINRKNAKSCF